MTIRRRRAILLLSALSLLVGEGRAALAGEWRLSGDVSVEARWFPSDPSPPGRFEGVQPSLSSEPELSFVSSDRKTRARIVPFVRLDGRDDERTHVDLREAYWSRAFGDWELVAGIDRVFWGVAEARHLVDVVNQKDLLEDIDEEDKLGQPMVRLARQSDWGRLEGLVLVGFRERPFPGDEGRLAPPLPVDEEGALFESRAENERIDLALRYTHYVGDWDIGAHAFRGTDREPQFLPSADGDELVPFYPVISQAGVDLQLTKEAWLVKLEALARDEGEHTSGAMVGGVEYTLFQVGGSSADLGLLAEYLADGRDDTQRIVPFEDDVFVGARLAFNDVQDTQALLGAVIDRREGAVAASFEADRRLGDAFKLEIEARFFLNVDESDPLAPFASDDFVNVRIGWYF